MGQVISVLLDPNVFTYSMGTEWAGSCHTRSFIIDGGGSAEVHWEANKDQKVSKSKIHKFIFVLQDNRRETIL